MALTSKPAASEPTPVPIPRPRIQVLERAIQNPFGIPSTPIHLRDPGFVCHWINTELKGGSQLHYATESGYLKVRPEYLHNPETFQFQVSPDGYVTRGQRGQEILMYTTVEHAKAREQAKNEANLKRMRNPTAGLSDAAASHIGAEGAEFLDRHTRPIGSVTTNREMIKVDDEGAV